MSVAQHHLRVELTLMRTLHLTNILLPLSLITASCLSPGQRSTQNFQRKPPLKHKHHKPFHPQEPKQKTHVCVRCAAAPCSEGAVVKPCVCVSLCKEASVCSLHGELCHYLILAETSCRPLCWLVIKHEVTSPCVTHGTLVLNKEYNWYTCCSLWNGLFLPYSKQSVPEIPVLRDKTLAVVCWIDTRCIYWS